MTSRIFRAFCFGVAFLAFAGCASEPPREYVAAAKPDRNAHVVPNGDSYIVFGLKPETVRLTISDGTVKDGTFTGRAAGALPVYGPADDGFIVFKAKPGETLAIIGAQILGKSTDTNGPRFNPCEETVAFNVPAGKVLYVASVAFGISPDASYVPGGQIVPSFYTQIGAARQFLLEHYPDLAPDLEMGKVEFLKLADSHC